MNVFEAVRNSVTARQAAELYGIKVSHSGMALCPFHNDKHPSLKLDSRHHCFRLPGRRRCNTNTVLIIVDTLQKIRVVGNESYSYAADYQIITGLKEFTDRHNICVLAVHHTRKMEASDSFDMISGTNGLLGATDGGIVLQKKKRIDNTAVMQIVGRDQEDQELELEFDRDHCLWLLAKAEKTIRQKLPDPLMYDIAGFMMDKAEWTGSATELAELLSYPDLEPNHLTRKLNANVSELYNQFGISYTQNKRGRGKRTFTLKNLNCELCMKVTLKPEKREFMRQDSNIA